MPRTTSTSSSASSSTNNRYESKSNIAPDDPDPIRQHVKLPVLTDDNFDAWNRQLKNFFYGKGWLALYEAGCSNDEPVLRVDETSISSVQRRHAWLSIYTTLSPEMTAIIDDVRQGEVEQLIKRIRQQYYRSTIATRFSIRDKLSTIRLEDHTDIEHYFAAIKNTISTLSALGDPVSEEGQVYALLKGLPSPDYESVKVQALAPRTVPYRLTEVLTLIRDLADRSNVIGTKRKANTRASVFTGEIKEDCRDFIKGKCKRGMHCRYNHVKQPHSQSRPCRHCGKSGHLGKECALAPTCAYCHKKGHKQVDCFQRQDAHFKHQAMLANSEAHQQTQPPPSQHTQSDTAADLFPSELFECHTTEVKRRPMHCKHCGRGRCPCRCTESNDPSATLGRSTPASDRPPTQHTKSYQVSEEAYNASVPNKTRANPLFLLDSGATVAIITDPDLCINHRPTDDIVVVGGKREIPATAAGTLTIWIGRGNRRRTHTLPHVLICPNFGKNIIPESVWHLYGGHIHKHQNKMNIFDRNRNLILSATLANNSNLFYFRPQVLTTAPTRMPKRLNLVHTALTAAASPTDSLTDKPDTVLAGKDTDSTTDSSRERLDCGHRLSPRTALQPEVSNKASHGHSRDLTRLSFHAHPKVSNTASHESHGHTHEITTLSSHAKTATSNAVSLQDSEVSILHSTPSRATDRQDTPCTPLIGKSESPTEDCYSCYVARSYSDGLSDLMLWHHRLGHKSFRTVARLLKLRLPNKSIFCRSCVDGKLDRYPLTRANKHVTVTPDAPRPGYLLFTDAAGPFRVSTRSGKRYLYLFIDDFSRMIFPFLVKSLSEFYDILVSLSAKFEAEFGREKVIAQLLGDSHRVHFSNAVEIFCSKKGIQMLFTAPYTPALNPAERYIGIVIEMARVMLLHASAPQSLAGEAITYACFLLARIPVDFSDGSASPLERWHDRKIPNAMKHAKVWGCSAWPKVLPSNKLGKFDSRAQPTHLFVGIDSSTKSYRLLRLPGFSLIFSAHCAFHENIFPLRGSEYGNPHAHADTHTPLSALSYPTGGDHVDFAPTSHQPPADISASAGRPRRPPMPSEAFLRALPDIDVPPAHQETIAFAVDTIAATCATDAKVYTPSSHSDAMMLPQPSRTEWRDAERSEFRSHMAFGTLGPRIDRCPPGYVPIPTAVIYKTKRDGRKKARLVIRGYRMRSSMDFNETFAPIPRVTSIRLWLALTIENDYEVVQADAHTAFLSSPMDALVYVSVPAFFNDDPDTTLTTGEPSIHPMLKGIPGTRQGSYLFNNRAHRAATDAGFVRACDDYCLYKHKDHTLWAVIWVDDFDFSMPHAVLISVFKPIFKKLQDALALHEVRGPDPNEFDILGVRVRRNRTNKTATLDQSIAISKLLQKADMSNCNGENTPLAVKSVFTKKDSPQTAEEALQVKEEAKKYRSIVASLNYLAQWTRVDIAFAAGKLSKFMQNPGPEHFKLLKRTLRYLSKYKDRCLLYDFSKPPQLDKAYGYYDASNADDVDTLRSTMANLFFYKGCLISWKSKLHTYVTLSTNNSEYCASAKAAREATWLKKIFQFLDLPAAKVPIDLFSDSAGAIAMNQNPVHHEANKHCDLADHYAREQVARKVITISYMPTKEMLADVLTKPLGAPEFNKFISRLMTDAPLQLDTPHAAKSLKLRGA